MVGALTRTSSGRAIRVLDAGLVVWMVAWVVLGIAIGREVRHLTRLSDTVVTAGRAVQETGQALQTLEGVPFVGGRIAALDRRIQAAGRSAVVSGEESRASIGNLAVLLTVTIAVIPTVPILALYAPFRISRRRDVRAVRRAAKRAAKRAADDPAFEEFLARRAAQNLPYHRLREVSSNPWRDLEEGRYRALADAELRRLGIGRTARRLRKR
ncbi:MAG TPA: hypothetical protein VF986_08350 [Actinomycetota bacterium]